MHILWEKDDFRIVEHEHTDYDTENIIGDGVSPEERAEIIDLINHEGVYGFELQRWNCDVGAGWEHVDSCWGFIGRYSKAEETFNHYIVAEMIATAKERAQNET